MGRIRKNDRYSRQIMFSGLGQEGQERISQGRVLIVGIGALGTVIANNLARAGVGYLKLVDRDFVELSNLQRQTLFDEQDIEKSLPKAVAACEHLQAVNSEIEIEPVVTDVTPQNVEGLLKHIDLVLDGTDNMETRLLLNDACLKNNIPWIYGAALGGLGMSMNIIPGETACFRCFIKEAPPPGSMPTCSTAGILGMTTGLIGCIQSTEALKILNRSSAVRKNLLIADLWQNTTEYVSIGASGNCPACGQRKYEFLAGKNASSTTSLCGSSSMQINPGQQGKLDFECLQNKLCQIGSVTYNRFMLKFQSGKIDITLFPDGRAIIKNVTDEKVARSIYAEYIGS